jgi:acyl-CoA synthetase (NDP forming)
MTPAKDHNLSSFLEPRGVAVIGSMREPMGEGLTLIRNMLDFGFSGKLYPISRSNTQVLGMKAYSTVNDVSDPIDLACVITPPPTVIPIIKQCGEKRIKAVIVSTEGYAEVGSEGAAQQRQLVETAHRYGIRILGPNTLGVFNSANSLITDPYPIIRNKPLPGGIGYASQTGLLTFGVHPLKDHGYPINKIVDFGNKSDINELDLLPYLADDPSTNVICMHLEDIRDGQGFLDVASKAAAQKPVLLYKPGRSEAGAKAASSHTGSLAGDDQVYDSAFKQAGVVRLRTWQEFWEIPKTLSMQPLPKGNRIAIVTATGGGGVISMDAAAEAGLTAATFSANTVSELNRLSPRLTKNPIDVGPLMSIRQSPFGIYEDVVPVVLRDPQVDCATFICHVSPPIVTVFARLAPEISKIGKPVTVFAYGIDLAEMRESARQLEARGLPVYLDLETAVKALGIAAAYSRVRARLQKQN